MQAEREELIKRVFPHVRKLCEERGVGWGEIDLRWGITEEEAEQGGVVPICLAETRNSSVLLCILGERYGWVPDAGTIDAELSRHYPGLELRRDNSLTELEIVFGALERPPTRPAYAFFYLRDRGYLERLPAGAKPEDYVAEGPAAEARLEALKGRIRRSGWPIREAYRDAAELGRLVLADLTELLERVAPADASSDPLDRERAAHRRFAASRYEGYVGRQVFFDRLDRHAAGMGPPLVVCGGPSTGKTALLSNWSRHWLGEPLGGIRLGSRIWERWSRWLQSRPRPEMGDFFLLHLVGATGRSTSWPEFLQRLLAELKRHFGLTGVVPTSPAGLSAALPAWLATAAARGRLVIVLDGLDELQGGDPSDLGWLPDQFSPTVRLIVSTRPGAVLDRLGRWGWPVLRIPPLRTAERRQLITDYLNRFGKKLDRRALQKVAAAPNPCPLYLRTIAEELRVFGIHEQIRERLSIYLNALEVTALFGQVLVRLEKDYEREKPGLVGDSLALLAAARHGLGERELLDLLGGPSDPLPAAYWSPFFLAVRESLVERDGLLTFAHAEFGAAVRVRYLPRAADEQVRHRRLADYFRGRPWSRRRLEEWPWQLLQLDAWAELRSVLAEPDFLARAWPDHASEIKAYWALLEANTAERLVDAYGAILADPAAYGEVARYVAGLLAETGYTAAAQRLGAALEEEARRRGDSDYLREILGLRAVCLQAGGDARAALRALEEHEPLCRATGARADLAANLSNQGVLRRALGDSGDALALHRQAEMLCRELEDAVGLQQALGNQAVLLLERGDGQAARALLREQERLCRVVVYLPGLQQALGNQAVVAAADGALHQALQLHREEEGLCRRLYDQAGLRDCLDNQARVLRRLADYDTALAKLNEMEQLCCGRQDWAGAAAALQQKAYLYAADLRVPGEGIRLAREARRLAVEHGQHLLQQELDAWLAELGREAP
jgi:hypothetical protein